MRCLINVFFARVHIQLPLEENKQLLVPPASSAGSSPRTPTSPRRVGAGGSAGGSPNVSRAHSGAVTATSTSTPSVAAAGVAAPAAAAAAAGSPATTPASGSSGAEEKKEAEMKGQWEKRLRVLQADGIEVGMVEGRPVVLAGMLCVCVNVHVCAYKCMCVCMW